VLYFHCRRCLHRRPPPCHASTVARTRLRHRASAFACPRVVPPPSRAPAIARATSDLNARPHAVPPPSPARASAATSAMLPPSPAPAHRALRVDPASPQSLEQLSVELTISVTCVAARYLGHRGRETENWSHVSTFGWRVFLRVFEVFEPHYRFG
jgi:hypothetical protein